jgi:hypothetical protein
MTNEADRHLQSRLVLFVKGWAKLAIFQLSVRPSDIARFDMTNLRLANRSDSIRSLLDLRDQISQTG